MGWFRRRGDFRAWLQWGFDQGWCGPPVCFSHDGLPASEVEDEEWNDGGDPCVHILRLYEDVDQKTAVELSHSPSRWRASNAGLTR